MKKILLAFTVALSVGAVSCSREHTCECRSTDTGGNPTSTKVTITGTKKQAIQECDEMDENPTFGASTDCEIISL